MAKALDAGQDVVGGLGPAERFGVGIVLVDERGDRVVQRGDAAMDAAADLPIGQQGENRSTWLSQEALVGVWWTCQCGRFSSQLRTVGALWVA